MAISNSLRKQNTADVDFYPSAPAQPDYGAVQALTAEREAKQMEIAMVTAKRFPRDYTSVEQKVERNCTRYRLAAQAQYSFPRGGETISGASVRLMEVIAQCYGNVEFGVNELQRYDGYSEGEAYAWDFENNIRVARKFTVPHYRDTKTGKKKVTEDRDIREIVFNYGSRNMRACLERVIPRDLVDFALEKCKATLNGDSVGLADRIRNCKEKFKEFEIDPILLERIIGEKFDNWTNAHLNKAIKYYNALRDGDTTKQILVENLIATISGAQIEELTGIVGTNQARINALKSMGYELGAIKDIPAADYGGIKETLQSIGSTKTEDKAAKAATKAATTKAAAPAEEEFNADEF
ncbi:MAG: hypothetical protein LUD19_01235 [Clostridia bacterium]|nr:hypothetical protein [Clostridia bacterium]